MADYLVTDTELTSIANAIRTKNDTSTDISFPTGFVSAIQSIPTGIANSNDVNFYDYDGTILYSYSASEFAQLTAMPPNPFHKGLIAQGWNWTLAQAQTFVAQCGAIDIGAMYETDDGKSRLYIHIINDLLLPTTIYWNQDIANGVIVDWGDGSSSTTVSGTGNVNATHTYASPGYYVITMDRANNQGTYYFGTSTENTCSFLGPVGMANSPELCKLEKAEIGSLNSTSLGMGAFEDCFHLETITIPNGQITTLQHSTFRGTQCLKYITIPTNLNDIRDSVFQTNIDWEGYSCALQSISLPPVCYIGYTSFYNCPNLKRIIYPYPYPDHETLNGWNVCACHSLTQIIFPEGYEYLGEQFFHFDLALIQITLPSTIITIADNPIRECDNLKALHLKSTTPPTLQGTLAIPQTCTIYVPQSTGHTILDAYKAATNWSALASQIQEEP